MLSIHNRTLHISCVYSNTKCIEGIRKIQHVYVSKNTLTCTYYNNGNDMISCSFFRMLIKERISDGVKNEKNKK